MAIGFFLEYEGQSVQLPVNPAELAVVRAGSNESADILTLGEVTIIKKPKLAEIGIESYFPEFPDSPAVLTKSDFKKPQFYWDFIVRIRDDQKPCRLVITDTNINILVSIESFDRRFVAMDNDTHYSLQLKEYQPYGVRTISLPDPPASPSVTPISVPAPSPAPVRANTSGEVTVGANVIVNGRLHVDSYGNGAGQTRTNYSGKVNFIKEGRTCPYHVTSPTGSWLGWVNAGAVKLQ